MALSPGSHWQNYCPGTVSPCQVTTVRLKNGCQWKKSAGNRPLNVLLRYKSYNMHTFIVSMFCCENSCKWAPGIADISVSMESDMIYIQFSFLLVVLLLCCCCYFSMWFGSRSQICRQRWHRLQLLYRQHHDDVIKWNNFPRHWPFVRGIPRSPVNSPHKGQWRGALMVFFICAWTNSWVNNDEPGDLRRYRAHYDVTVMCRHNNKLQSVTTKLPSWRLLVFSDSPWNERQRNVITQKMNWKNS